MPSSDNWKYDPEYHRFVEFLGLDTFDRDDFEVARKSSVIRDWLELDHRSKDFNEVKQKISATKKLLGTTFTGKTLLNELYQHVRFDLDRRRQQAVAPLSQDKTPEIIREIKEAQDHEQDTSRERP